MIRKPITEPRFSSELAELVGIILGDGSIFIKRYSIKASVYQLRICGHITLDRDYLINFVKPLISELFSICPAITFFRNSALYVCCSNKQLVEFLLKIGMEPGDKVRNQVSIPGWIKENKEYLKSCIRGLIDTDGSVFRMSNQDPQLVRISFKNHSKNLLVGIREGLILLGFSPSKIIGGTQFFLSRKADIEKYINQIGFNNSKHSKRLLRIAPSYSGQFKDIL